MSERLVELLQDKISLEDLSSDLKNEIEQSTFDLTFVDDFGLTGIFCFLFEFQLFY